LFQQVEIPQHPVDLHGIVTRGTKELSSTLQEFRGVRILQRSSKVKKSINFFWQEKPQGKSFSKLYCVFYVFTEQDCKIVKYHFIFLLAIHSSTNYLTKTFIFFKAATVPDDQTDRSDATHGRSSPKFHLPEQQLPRSPVEDSKLIKPLVMQFHLVKIPCNYFQLI
jgi:hypothetical protein